MQFSEVVKRVIALATPINEYWERELPKRHPKYPLVDPAVPDPPPPPEEAELRHLLASLPIEEVYKLLALADVGRGVPAHAFDKRWHTYIKDAPELQWAIEYQVETAPLAEYLLEGRDALKKAGIDLDAGLPAHA